MQSALSLALQQREARRQTDPPGTDARCSLLDYVPILNPQLRSPDHLAPVVDLFERADQGEEVRACVSIPPQHGKTTLALTAVIWLLKRHPDWTIGYGSYSGKQALSKSRLARELADEARMPRKADADSLGEWRLHRGSGGMLARGVGEGLTGQELNVGIVDDPHKDRVDAESITQRNRVSGWMTSTFLTRLHQGGSAIVIHSRWHPDDTIGQLKKQAERGEVPWQILNLPAIGENGLALCEWLRPLDFLIRKRAEIGPYDWASLYQGEPRPRSGQVFHDVYHFDQAPTQGYRVAIGVDLAYSAKTSSDWSVAVVLAQVGDVKHVLEVRRAQVQADRFALELADLRSRYRYATMRWYAFGAELGAADLINASQPMVALQAVSRPGDKFLRAQRASIHWNAGRILVPREAPWLNAFLSVVCGFTGVGDLHDDDVDALAAASDALDDVTPPFSYATSGASAWKSGAPL